MSQRDLSLCFPPLLAGWVGLSRSVRPQGLQVCWPPGPPFFRGQSWSVVILFSLVSVTTLDHRGLEFAGLPLGPPASHLGNDCLGRVVLSFQFVLSVLPGDMTVWATGTLDTNSGQRGLDLGVNFGGLTI